MPGLLQRSCNGLSAPCVVGSPSSDGIWSKQRDEITFDQLQKFWSQLPLQARQELLRIDKQTLFEQARKNLYCSRCNGLLLEGFSQIVMYAKALQQEDVGMYPSIRNGASKAQIDCESGEVQDPLVHPWGGLATTREGILTLLDCFINAKSLKALQNVFDNARARERERELLYPDACGGGGRGWISQGITNYGRGHGTRETCALHTARLSCETLVGFWSALSDDTRLSLLRMKEEDFIERLMYRFDSKRFCRDCRRNVIREFKELKELKRMRREPCCSNWFCVADTAFQYEVLEDSVYADWRQSFTETVGTYDRFEWAIGTGEGKSDILDFEDVGMNGNVQVDGLNLGGLSACFITLRARRNDGRYTELCVKAHALKGQPCVHRRLIVGDGYVTITKGESITRFFEHAEEAEEEEDDDVLDKDGNEYDGDGSRPQKHAKSPELAREFLLDAATVIFKEQVEKAFREGTARQNAHSIFVCLALKLLEERIHVACKEIITLEKQIKLLEEEEREKREEEERKERRRNKEREKKLRRKERVKGKERERERKHIESSSLHCALPVDSSSSTHDDSPNTPDSGDSVSEPGDIALLIIPQDNNTNEQFPEFEIHDQSVDGELNHKDGDESFILEQSKSSRRKLRFKKDSLPAIKRYDTQKQSRERFAKVNSRNPNPKFGRIRDRYDFQSCSCNHNSANTGRPLYRSGKYSHGCYLLDSCVVPKGKLVPNREIVHTKQVWEPSKKCSRSSSDPEITTAKPDPSDENGSDDCSKASNKSNLSAASDCSIGLDQLKKSDQVSVNATARNGSSSSDSSCLSDSSTARNPESSSTSDSEETGQQQSAPPPASCTQSHVSPKQSFHVPVFPLPAIRYQNQRASCWSEGLVQFPQPNHYMYPCPFEYVPPPSNQSLDYRVLQPFLPPVLSVGHHSLGANRVYVAPAPPKDQPQQPPEAPNRRIRGCRDEVPSFSLFHFGPVPIKEENGGLPVSRPNISCSKDETGIEEYSLFAASNGSRFSFF